MYATKQKARGLMTMSSPRQVSDRKGAMCSYGQHRTESLLSTVITTMLGCSSAILDNGNLVCAAAQSHLIVPLMRPMRRQATQRSLTQATTPLHPDSVKWKSAPRPTELAYAMLPRLVGIGRQLPALSPGHHAAFCIVHVCLALIPSIPPRSTLLLASAAPMSPPVDQRQLPPAMSPYRVQAP